MNQSLTRGFTMLEVLVALLIVSLGLLGLAGLQTMGLRNNTGSAQRTIATQLAYDMSDRMRANNVSVLSGDYNYSNYGDTPGADGRNSPPLSIPPRPVGEVTANCFVAGTGCTQVQVAYQDIYDWNQQICAQLPQSSTSCAVANGPWGVVCVDSSPNDGTPSAPACDNLPGAPYAIKIWWIEDRNNPTLPVKRWVTSFQP